MEHFDANSPWHTYIRQYSPQTVCTRKMAINLLYYIILSKESSVNFNYIEIYFSDINLEIKMLLRTFLLYL